MPFFKSALRAATSLSRLLRDQNRSTEAIALLAPMHKSVHRGFRNCRSQNRKGTDR
jgi:hypothetical protein